MFCMSTEVPIRILAVWLLWNYTWKESVVPEGHFDQTGQSEMPHLSFALLIHMTKKSLELLLQETDHMT